MRRVFLRMNMCFVFSSGLQVPVRVPVRMADVHSEQSRLLSDGRGADSGGAAERTQQQKDQEEEKRYTIIGGSYHIDKICTNMPLNVEV